MAKKFLALGNIDKAINVTAAGKETTFGGGTYSSIAAMKLGYDSAVMTKGNDELKKWLKKLEEMGIRVFLEKDAETLTVINEYDASTKMKRQKLIAKTGKISWDIDEKFDIVHVNPLLNEIDEDMIHRAKKQCKILSLDAQGMVREAAGDIVKKRFCESREEWLNDADVLHVGEEEAKFVSKAKSPEDICRDLQSLGPKIVLLTFGEKGSIICGENIEKIPAFKVKAADPIGAGDVYSTAFVAKYFETGNERESGIFASAAASFVVEEFGYKNIQPREKVEERAKTLMKKIEEAG